MTAYATLADFEDRYVGTLDADDMTRVETLLADASALVEEVAGGAITSPPATLVPLVCEVARRAFDNPAGLRGETIGDYTWRVGESGSGVYLTANERRTVRRAAGVLGVGSLTMSSDFPATQTLGV